MGLPRKSDHPGCDRRPGTGVGHVAYPASKKDRRTLLLTNANYKEEAEQLCDRS